MTFAHMIWFWLLVFIPLLAALSLLTWKRRGKQWHRMVAPRLRDRLSETRAGHWYFASFFIALLGLAILIVSLAQPEGGEEFQTRKTEGRNILFCLDISRSMLTEDLAPNRLSAAKAAAQEIMDEFPNDRAGLLVFAGETYVQVPLTPDRSYVRRAIQQTSPFDLPTGGSDLSRAIRDGGELLEKTGQKSNIMILLSDGEEHTEGLAVAAREARQKGIFVYALGFGTKAGAKIPDPRRRDGFFRDIRGGVVHSSLNDTSLRLIAQETEGVYSQGVGPAFLKKLGETIEQMEAFESEGKHLRVAKPLFQWFLLPGILLLMISIVLRLIPTLSRGSTVALLLFATIATMRGDEIAVGRAALAGKDFTQAAQSFSEAARKTSGESSARLHLAAGIAAYRAKNWLSAAASFGETLRSDNSELQENAHFSLSNSLFYQGAEAQDDQERATLWENAIEHLKEAQAINPENSRIQDNLEAIAQKLQELRKKQEQQQQSQKQNQNQEKQDQEQNEEEQDKQKQDQGEPKQPDQEQDQKQEQGDQGQPDEEKENQEEGKGNGDSSQKENEPQNEPQEDQQSQGGGSQGEEKEDEGKDGQEQNSQGKNPNDEKDAQEQQEEQEQAEPKSQKQSRSASESPKERARRLLREYADLGRRPPRARRYMPRRPLKDW